MPAAPDEAVAQMIRIVEQMTRVYAQGTEALKSGDIPAFQKIQFEEVTQANAFRDGASEFYTRREELSTADPVLRKRLEETHRDFTELSQTYLEALSLMDGSVKKLTKRILASAAQQAKQKQAATYTRDGSLGSGQSGQTISMGIIESA